MLVRRSTLTFVVVAAGVFFLGSSFVVYQRPEYIPSSVVPDNWRDWSGLGSSDGSDIPLPNSGDSGKSPNTWSGVHDPSRPNPPTSPHKPPPSSDDSDGEVHILPISPGDIEVKPLPVSSDNPQWRPVEITSPALKERLIALLGAPMPTYAQFVKESAKTCPTEVADRQVNPDQHAGNLESWLSIETEELVTRRLAIVQYMEVLDKGGKTVLVGEKGKAGKGRGIVMTGGNQDTMARLLVTLRILREEYKSTLPVEVFCFPNEINSPDTLHQLSELKATVHELSGRTKLNIWKNFQIKAESIVASSFEEVLYLDSDNVPLRDPAHLFDSELYAGKGQPGAVFWPDINKDHPDNPIWRLTGKKCDYSEWEIESGQILINKSGNNGLNLAALHVAMHMQLEHEFYFSLSGGDKDTFRYAFWALQLPFSVSPRWLSAIGFHSAFDGGRFCGVGMLQYDLDPPSSSLLLSTTHPLPLFVHANLLKHLGSFVPPGSESPFSIIKRARDDVADSRALDAVRAFVYNTRGMCIDYEFIGVEAAEDQPGQRIMEEEMENRETYGGEFIGWYQDVYEKYGGRKGGW